MIRTFENPSNKHRETVETSDSVAVFFLGLLYLMYKGLWAHVFVWFLVVVAPCLGGTPFFVFTLPLASIVYAMSIQDILSNRYLRQGWREVEANPADSYISPGRGAAPPTTLATKSASDIKICPYCAEEVKAAAIKCRHCQSDLPPNDVPIDTGDKRIAIKDGMYTVGALHFAKLEDAQRHLSRGFPGPAK